MNIIFTNNVVKEKNRLLLLFLLPLLLILTISGGCLSSQPSKFYILTPVNHDAAETFNLNSTGNGAEGIDLKNSFGNLTLGIGPVSIAKYLDRSQIVVRLSPNEVKLEDFHKWAGSPRDEIPAILMENLAVILGIETIYKYPWKRYVDPDYQISVEILQLDGQPGESVHLVARWEILQGKAGKRVENGRADFTARVSADGDGFDLYAASLSKALGKLSGLIAQSLVDIIITQ